MGASTIRFGSSRHSSHAFCGQVLSHQHFFDSIPNLSLLRNHSKVLYVSAGTDHEVMALSESGVADVTGMEMTTTVGRACVVVVEECSDVKVEEIVVEFGSTASGEVNLVEWLKTMVTNRNPEGALDPRLPEKPSSRGHKRTLSVALRCVDSNAQNRPKIGHVVHVLEADEFPFRDDRRTGPEHGRSHRDILTDRLLDKRVTESGDSSGYESCVQSNISMLRKKDPEE
ncbi:hypothetical protein NL676_024927 [Syzygium grande]|nr:hypothetical protein NL676_024927 [Syzygium grande]